MCEIASLSPVHGSDAFYNYASTLYEENRDGIGVVAVFRDGDSFSYETHSQGTNKGEAPDWGEIMRFYQANDDCWKFVIHARLATTGDKTDTNAHPLHIEDKTVGIECIVHNGIVYGDTQHRRRLEDEGHEFSTGVDSEVIAHAHGDVPDDLDELERPGVNGSLNYLLFAENGILVRNDGKYHVTEDLEILCTHRKVYGNGTLSDSPNKQGFALFKPDGSVNEQSVSETPGGVASTWSATTTRGKANIVGNNGSHYQRSYDKYSNRTWSANGSYDDGDDDDNTFGDEGLAENHPRWNSTGSYQRYDYFCTMHQTLFSEEENGCPTCIEEGYVGDDDDERDKQQRNHAARRRGPYQHSY